jgi:cytochrome c-type biogenesis protein CcmH
LAALLIALLAAGAAVARDAAPAAADPVLEARMTRITSELRCLVCQNETIADSTADLAADLRRQVREMLSKGDDDATIIKYMTDRYGDFVLYRPPLKASTAVLWLGPAVLLAIALLALVVVIRRRARLADDQFEPEPMLDDGAEPVDAPVRPGTFA